MREDLELYYKLLKTAMVELINKDYADFVNLSTNLVSRVQTSPYMLIRTIKWSLSVVAPLETRPETSVIELFSDGRWGWTKP